VYVSTTLPERVYLYVNGHVRYSTLANTGVAGAATEFTTTPVYLRYTTQTMSGTNPNGTHYSDPGIPWVSYFLGGEALHGFIRSSYGWPQSLGCVEMPFANAKTLWPWTPIGTLVSVAAARP
jgi:lipoprotein-anchoring transpeptidase ErfK/SrfK